MQERDAPVPEDVRRERGDARCRAGASERGSEAVSSEASEDGPIRYAIIPQAERHARGDVGSSLAVEGAGGTK